MFSWRFSTRESPGLDRVVPVSLGVDELGDEVVVDVGIDIGGGCNRARQS